MGTKRRLLNMNDSFDRDRPPLSYAPNKLHPQKNAVLVFRRLNGDAGIRISCKVVMLSFFAIHGDEMIKHKTFVGEAMNNASGRTVYARDLLL